MNYVNDLYRIKEYLLKAYDVLQDSGMVQDNCIKKSLLEYALINTINKVDIAIGRKEEM